MTGTNPTRISAPEGLPYIDIEREFDAPVDRVFEAYSDPALVARWLGPRGYEMTIDTWDFRSGGGYRYVHRSPDGGEFGFRGVIHTVRPNELVIQTFEFEGWPDGVALEYARFEDLGSGRTRVLAHNVNASVEARDGHVESGMERGVTQGFERLDELLAAARAGAPQHD